MVLILVTLLTHSDVCMREREEREREMRERKERLEGVMFSFWVSHEIVIICAGGSCPFGRLDCKVSTL